MLLKQHDLSMIFSGSTVMRLLADEEVGQGLKPTDEADPVVGDSGGAAAGSGELHFDADVPVMAQQHSTAVCLRHA